MQSSANFRCRLLLAVIVTTVPLFAVAETGSARTAAGAKPGVAKPWSVQWQPALLVDGAPVVFEVTPPARLTRLSAKWLGHQVLFSYDPAGKAWYGIAGVSLETRPGTYALELSGTTSQASNISFTRQITVRAAKYPSIEVTVAKRFTEPSKEQLERIHQDKTVKQDVFQHTNPEREWSGKFRRTGRSPQSPMSSAPGGLLTAKFKACTRDWTTPSPPAPRFPPLMRESVLLAGPLYFEGNCVVLDHGQGLLTLYLHLSEIKVKQGERIAAGQEIGLSGGTGRATGPHLHLAVRWQGVYLNPATLLTLKLP